MQLEPLEKTPWETVQDRAKHPAEKQIMELDSDDALA